MKWHEQRTVINLISAVGNTNQRMGQTRTHGHTRGCVRCLGGVSIPFQLVAPAVSLISRSGKRYESKSRSECQERLNDWY
jgi:hypothetical protein